MINKWFLLNGPHRLRNGLLLATVIFITGWLLNRFINFLLT